jgi:hypothetical protein
MTELYRKNSKGRYEKCGFDVENYLSNGIWMIENSPNSRSTTSLVWKVGDLKKPVDVVTIAALQTMESKLVNYLMKLGEEGSEELKEAREMFGGYLKGAVGYVNISASDLCSLFLRRIALECEETTVPKSWSDIFWKFRQNKNLTDDQRTVLNQLEQYLKDNNIKHKV